MENQEVKRKKLLYRSWYRGCKETDKILGIYVKRFIDEMDETALNELELLLNEEDTDIYDWVSGKQQLPERLKGNKLLKNILNFSFSDEFNRIAASSN